MQYLKRSSLESDESFYISLGLETCILKPWYNETAPVSKECMYTHPCIILIFIKILHSMYMHVYANRYVCICVCVLASFVMST